MRSSSRKTITAKASKGGKQPGLLHRPGKGTSGVKEKGFPVQGRPGIGLTRQSFSPVGFTETMRPIFRKRTDIRVVHKPDISKGLTQPEAAKMTTTHGVLTGRGFGSVAREISKFTMVATGKNRRVLKAPSPTGGAGVRNPYRTKTRVGRGSGKRYSSKRFGG